MNSDKVKRNVSAVDRKSKTNFKKGRKAMKARIFFAAWLTAAFCLTSLSYAEVPQMINYQGTLTDTTGSPITSDYDMTFSIYNAPTEGIQLWTETHYTVPVEEGIFSVLLGIPASVFDGSARYLGVSVGTDDEMTPRRPVVSVGYAFHSESSDTATYARGAPATPDDDWVISGNKMYTLIDYVGIGTSSPGNALDIESDAIYGTKLGLKNTSTGGDKWIINSTGSGNDDGGGNLVFYDVTTATLGPIIKSNGNVGIGFPIGSTGPGTKLDIHAGTIELQPAGYSGQLTLKYKEISTNGPGDYDTGISSNKPDPYFGIILAILPAGDYGCERKITEIWVNGHDEVRYSYWFALDEVQVSEPGGSCSDYAVRILYLGKP